MSRLYPEIDAHDGGMLDVGDGHAIHWEVVGNPAGKPAVVLHGGPGSGAAPWWRRLFDPGAYRVVLFDQRGCGRSTPHTAEPIVDLTTNPTAHLISDIELLRRTLAIDRWLVLGGSWGSTLSLAYAEAHPAHVSELVLFSVVTTTRREVEWITHDVGRVFPEQWQRFCAGVPQTARDGSLVEAYSRLLHDPDPAVREQAARDWCDWEDAHITVRPGHRRNPRYDDPAFRMAFARLVTHYWRHAAFLDDAALLRNVHELADIPGILIHGRLDVSSPLDIAWHLSRARANSTLVLVDEAGHSGGDPAMTEAIITATDAFRGVRPKDRASSTSP